MGKIFTAKQIHKIDAYTIENEPISSINLMERAASALAAWILEKFPVSTPFIFFAGPGNNGGDAFALARILSMNGVQNIRFYLLKITDKLSPDSEINHKQLLKKTPVEITELQHVKDFPEIMTHEWVIDGLFGSGLSRPLDGPSRLLVEHINQSPKAGVISIDIPSGLFSDDNSQNIKGSIVEADYTLSFEFPKLSFFYAENEKYIGQWGILPIGSHPDCIRDEKSAFYFLDEDDFTEICKNRSKFSHKGTFGHALIIAGSYGMMGAAILATRAAVRSGAGLVTVHIPRFGYNIIQSTVPESLVSIDESDLIYTSVPNITRFSAIAIGPGLGQKTNTMRGLKSLIDKIKVPLVIDADALNILSENKEYLEKLPENTILTPHPREFDRLTSVHSLHSERVKTQIEFSVQHKVIVVLKGAHTSIVSPDGTVWFNTSGNSGMAKGGSGDILTGMIVALLAQGFDPLSAAKLGVFIHGRAGDLALKSTGYHALTPSDIIANLGNAFKKIE